MNPQALAAIIKTKAEYGKVYQAQYKGRHVVCRPLTVAEMSVIPELIQQFKPTPQQLALAVVHLTLIYPDIEELDAVPPGVLVKLGNAILDVPTDDNEVLNYVKCEQKNTVFTIYDVPVAEIAARYNQPLTTLTSLTLERLAKEIEFIEQVQQQ